MRSGRRRGFRTAKLSQPAPTFRPLWVAVMGALMHPPSVVFGDRRNALGANRALCCCAMLRGAALRRLSGTRRLLCVVGCLFVCLFVCAPHATPRLSLAPHTRGASAHVARVQCVWCGCKLCAVVTPSLDQSTVSAIRRFANMDEFSLIGLGFLSAGAQAQAQAQAQRRTRDAQRRRISHSRVASLRSPACDSSRQRRHHNPVAAGDVRQLSRDRCTRPHASADANALWPPRRSGP